MKAQNIKLSYKIIEPDREISDYVERFYLISNNENKSKEIVLIPDGNIDIFFALESNDLTCNLIGLETQPTTTFFPPKCLFIGVSFKLLAIEYILHRSIADVLNSSIQLPNDFWDITANDLTDFDSFCNLISKKIKEKIPNKIDERKQELLQLIYESKGAL